MNKDKVINLAKQAGGSVIYPLDDKVKPDSMVMLFSALQRFTELVMADALEQPSPVQEQQPVAWMHVMDNTEGHKANGTGVVSITQKRKHPFGKPGVDFSKSYPVTSTPLFAAQPRKAVKLSDEEIQAAWASDNEWMRSLRNVESAVLKANGVEE